MAASATIRELLVRLGVDSDDAEAGLEKFDASIETAKANMEDLVNFAAKVTAAIAAVGAAALYQAVSTGESAEQIREQAAALGVTTDAYQELSFIASKYGIDSEKITVILSKLAVDQKAIADGNEEAAATYQALGLSVEQVTKAKPDELFALMADGFGTVTDASERLALASGLFGDRIASSLLPLLAGGSKGLEEMGEQAHLFGAVLDKDAIVAADEFNDRVENMGLIVEGLRNAIGMALIPTLTKLADEFIAWFLVNKDFIKAKIDEYVGKIADAFVKVRDAIVTANAAMGGLEGWEKLLDTVTKLTAAGSLVYVATKIIGIASALWGAAAGIAAAVGGFGELILVIAAIGSSLAALAAPFLVVQDLWTYIQGGDSVWGRLIERFREAGGALSALSGLMEAVGRVFGVVAPAIVQWFGEATTWIVGFIGFWADLGSYIASAIGTAIQNFQPLIDLLNVLTAGFNALADVLGSPSAPSAGLSAVTGATAGALPGSSTQAGLGAAASQAAGMAASYAPSVVGAAAPAGASSNVSLGGDTYNIVGVTIDEIKDYVERRFEEKERMTRDALLGGEL